MGGVDLVVYSIASPRRLDPETGVLHSSVIKPIGEAYAEKTVDFQSGVVSEIRAEPASSDEEIADTVKVMGGGSIHDAVGPDLSGIIHANTHPGFNASPHYQRRDMEISLK